MTRIAINGLGRVGRLLIRRFCEQPNDSIELVAVNDISAADSLLYLLKFDSVHGRFKGQISIHKGQLEVAGHSIEILSEADVSLLPWSKLAIDVVIDCTGLCRSREDAQKHLQAGARKVLVSAPVKAADCTLVLGVNEGKYDSKHHDIISNASCTTNSLAPPLKILSDSFGIEAVLATTVHAYTISQSLADKVKDKMIQGRAGAINIIPTSTGADVATVEVLPELEGRIGVTALRVPVANGSITDINAVLTNKVTVEDVNSALKCAAEKEMRGILEYSDEALVSTDIIGDTHSAIIHAQSTRVIQDKIVKIQSWYDNEYGYVCRLLDTVHLIGKTLDSDS
tara:strand:- start:37095 stop:38114 length:1020 start_codon:yes stop_codon:yes gene_type:complete